MAAVGAVVDAVFGSYDLKIAKQWRDEDVQHREQEKQWREDAIMREIQWRNADLERKRRVEKLANEKRIIDARRKDLTTVSQLSAFLAAFSMESIAEIKLSDSTSDVLMVFQGVSCCLTFISVLLCMLICTLLLLAVTRFVTHTLEHEVRALTLVEIDLVSPFNAWWLRKCESEWLLAYRLFRVGVSLFLIEVVFVAWVQFGKSIVAASVISCICVVTLLFFHLTIASRWRYLAKFPDAATATTVK